MSTNTHDNHVSRRHLVPFLFFFLFGVTIYSLQFGLLREFLKVAHGNEFTVGIFFFWWLLWGSAGSMLFGFIRRHGGSLLHWLLVLYVLWPLAVCVSYGVCITPASLIPGYVFKEALSFSRIHRYAAVMLLPSCGIAGILFPMGIELFRRRQSSLRWAYILESLGACAAAVLLSLIFLKAIPWLWIVLAGIFVNTILVSTFACPLTRSRRVLGSIAGILIFVLGLYYAEHQSGLWGAGYRFEGKDVTVLQVRETPYHSISVIAQKEQRSLYLNNALFSSVPDTIFSEEVVHPCLLQVPEARRVLIAGAITREIAAEIKKYPSIQTVDCVIQDPAVISLLTRYFFEEKAPAVQFYAMDIQRFLRGYAGRYDAVMMNYPLPLTIPFNYFYTREFFGLVKNVLSEEGVFSFFTEGSETYMPGPLKSLLAVYQATLQSTFLYVAALPGESIHFLASQRPVFHDAEAYRDALRRLKIQSLFINEQYLADRLAPERTDFLNGTLKTVALAEVNQAYFPKAYWYAFLWASGVARDAFSRVFNTLTTKRMKMALTIFICLLFLAAIVIPAHTPYRMYGFVFINGFYGMAMFFLCMALFQIFHGALYYKVSFLAAAYMIGLSSGAFIAGKVSPATLTKGVAAQSILSSIFVVCAWICYQRGIVVPESVLYGCAACVGLITGFLFVIFNSSLLKMNQKPSASAVASLLYALDLKGACIAALVFPSFILPLCGVFCSMIFLGGMVMVYGMVCVVKQCRSGKK